MAHIYPGLYSLPYYGKGFSFGAIKALEKSALEAFDYSLDVKPAQLSHFRNSLAKYSSRMDIRSPLYATHRMMTEILLELNLSSRTMRERPIWRPSSRAIDRVHAALVIGLNNLSEKFHPGYLHIDDVQPECPHFDASRPTFLVQCEDSSGRTHLCRRPYPLIRR